MEPCQIIEDGKLCGTPTEEVWDHPGMVEEVNEAMAAEGSPMKMTGPAICEAHMHRTPEL